MRLRCFALAAVIVVLLGVGAAREGKTLLPYWPVIVEGYTVPVLALTAALLLNVYAALYWTARRLFLRDMGAKLSHLEKQWSVSGNLAEELRRKLRERP